MERHAITLTTCSTKKFAKFTIQRHLAPTAFGHIRFTFRRIVLVRTNRIEKIPKKIKREREGGEARGIRNKGKMEIAQSN